MSPHLLTLAAEGHNELPIPPVFVGLLVLAILLSLLLGLLAFGGGRDRS